VADDEGERRAAAAAAVRSGPVEARFFRGRDLDDEPVTIDQLDFFRRRGWL
jgi:hypothetical protein